MSRIAYELPIPSVAPAAAKLFAEDLRRAGTPFDDVLLRSIKLIGTKRLGGFSYIVPIGEVARIAKLHKDTVAKYMKKGKPYKGAGDYLTAAKIILAIEQILKYVIEVIGADHDSRVELFAEIDDFKVFKMNAEDFLMWSWKLRHQFNNL